MVTLTQLHVIFGVVCSISLTLTVILLPSILEHHSAGSAHFGHPPPIPAEVRAFKVEAMVLPLRQIPLNKTSTSSTAAATVTTPLIEASTTTPLAFTKPSTTLSTESRSREKKSILIFIGILSAPIRKDRRNAVRKTWMTNCKDNLAVCLFFTDAQDTYGRALDHVIIKPLQEESANNGYDMVFVESPGGVNFARRYLWMVEYAIARYEFQYFLRMDDDHFLCIDRLLWELPQRPHKRLIWGFQHCAPGKVRIDAGWHLTSADVIQEFVSKKDSLLCHPFGDEAISLWLNDMKNMTYFADNKRIYHRVAARNPSLKHRSELCHSFLSLHGSYPEEINLFWQITSKEKNDGYILSPVEDSCKLSKTMQWKAFRGRFYAEPKPCKDNPIWQRGAMYRGRERRPKTVPTPLSSH